MTANEEYYENTIFENQVPWPNLGTVVDDEDPRHEALNDTFEYATPVEISELGQSTRGQLLVFDEATREEVAKNAGKRLADDAAAALRWTLPNESENVSAIHLLTAEEVATLERKSLTMLLDAAMPRVETDWTTYPQNHPLRRLAEEWRRRAELAGRW